MKTGRSLRNASTSFAFPPLIVVIGQLRSMDHVVRLVEDRGEEDLFSAGDDMKGAV